MKPTKISRVILPQGWRERNKRTIYSVLHLNPTSAYSERNDGRHEITKHTKKNQGIPRVSLFRVFRRSLFPSGLIDEADSKEFHFLGSAKAT
jgi:hypothetical protein